MKSRLQNCFSEWVFDILFEISSHWHPETFFLKSAPLFTQVSPPHRLSCHVCTTFTLFFLCVIVRSCAFPRMNLGSWTLLAHGTRVYAMTDDRGPAECTPAKHKCPHLTWWWNGTIPHANQMYSTSQRLGHDKDMNFMMFQVMKHDFLDNDINVLCLKKVLF